MTRWQQGALIVIGSVSVSTLVLASALAWGPHHCKLAFPMVIGCAVGSYENLAGGLFAASSAILAGWLAWSAVQLQITADEKRASADRLEVDDLLRTDVDNAAEALAAIWLVLEEADRIQNDAPNLVDHVDVQQKLDAAVWGVHEVAKTSWLETARKMASILGWEKRRTYEHLFASLDRLRFIADTEKFEGFELLDAVKEASNYVRIINPETSAYFEGFFERGGKAWSLAYSIVVQAGMDDEAAA